MGDYSRVEQDALAQVAAGAHMLDVNAGIPMADEAARRRITEIFDMTISEHLISEFIGSESWLITHES